MKKTNYFSSRAFRKGTLSVILIAVVIVAVILVNVLATAFSEKYPFSLDLTANKDYTISLTENYEIFVKGIQQKVDVTVCAAKTDFENGTYAANMAQSLYLLDYYEGSLAETTSKYARQVSVFMQSFGVLNGNINVSFVNPNSVTEFSSVSTKYADETLEYGDIIVSCEHTSADGNKYLRTQIIKVSEIFTLTENQNAMNYFGNYVYDITGSSLAGEVVSRLYIVTNATSVEVAILGGHNVSSDQLGYLETFLKKNNYTFTHVDNLLQDKIKDETKIAILAAPQNDYTAEEIKLLDSFLSKTGRTLVYLPSVVQPELQNLEEFLKEWGIQVLPVQAVDEENLTDMYGYNTIAAQPADSEYTKTYESSGQFMGPNIYRGLKTVFESQDGYSTQSILTTGENGYGKPLELPDDWTAEDAEYKGKIDLAILSTKQHLDSSNAVEGESHLLVMGGEALFVQEALTSSAYYNSTLTLNLFNGLSGQQETAPVAIEDKVISTTSFYDKIVNTNAGIIVIVVFVGVIPVGLVVLSLVIWMRRKKK